MSVVVIRNCRLVPGLGSDSGGRAAIRVRDGVIDEVGQEDAVLQGAGAGAEHTAVDAQGAYVLPGLIDMHTHFSVVHPDTTDELVFGKENDFGMAFRMAACARQALHAGVTTVRLVSEKGGSDTALRRAIQLGQVEGPRIVTAGQAITSTGGHGLGSHAVEADGVAEVRRRTRDQLKQGADLIKVMISGGISDAEEGLDKMLVSEDELRAAVEVAHAAGVKVAGHLGGAGVIEIAIECGVDTVEHGYVLTEQIAQRMADQGVWHVPTMMVTAGGEYFERIQAPRWLLDRLEAFAPTVRSSVALAYEHGVRILAGTDFLPAEPFDGTSAMVREIEHLRDAGLSNLDALRAATTLAAECLGMEGTVGCLTPGAAADLIAVREDPSADVSALRDMVMIMADGRLVETRGVQVT
jgi:imidazolonepropionase-like amidohydrolase